MLTQLEEPIYDIHKTYLENLSAGPNFSFSIPDSLPSNARYDFLGFSLDSPLGIPAGPLLDSRWIKFAADMGFSLLTYKTIRSNSYLGHPLPNIIPIHRAAAFKSHEIRNELILNDEEANEINQLTITNSFGMPSMSQEYLKEDIPKSISYLSKNQLLIVSVVGSGSKRSDLIDDFVDTAVFAHSCKAPVIELNLSCPNLSEGKGELFQDPDLVKEICSKTHNALPSVPLVIKISLFENITSMRKILNIAAQNGVKAICGINSFPMKVMDKNGAPALGKSREISGLCGAPIRQVALEFVKQANKIIYQDCLDLKIIGVGGITCSQDINDFLDAGATCCQSATGMMWNPFLAINYNKQR
jgi:dihydroorotate dehydrogenase (NAD+) catalytic subunit